MPGTVPMLTFPDVSDFPLVLPPPPPESPHLKFPDVEADEEETRADGVKDENAFREEQEGEDSEDEEGEEEDEEEKCGENKYEVWSWDEDADKKDKVVVVEVSDAQLGVPRGIALQEDDLSDAALGRFTSAEERYSKRRGARFDERREDAKVNTGQHIVSM